jgi:adenylate kinase family enzyme
MERAKTSGRIDDTEEIITQRLRTYNEQSRPVVELYKKFGKVREVDGAGDVLEVWKMTRKAMLPQVSFIIGS